MLRSSKTQRHAASKRCAAHPSVSRSIPRHHTSSSRSITVTTPVRPRSIQNRTHPHRSKTSQFKSVVSSVPPAEVASSLSSSFHASARPRHGGGGGHIGPTLAVSSLSRGEHVEALSFTQTLGKLTPYLWPKGQPVIKARVVTAVSCLLASKVFNVSVPVLFKGAVDSLTGHLPALQTEKWKEQQGLQATSSDTATAAASTTEPISSSTIAQLSSSSNTSSNAHIHNTQFLDDFVAFLQSPDFLNIATTQLPFALIIAWGSVRILSNLTNELKNTLFTRIMNVATTSIATDLLRHLLHMDQSFHIDRNTGSLSNAINRGTRSIGMALNMITFRTVPTIFEMALVVGMLATQCGVAFSAIAMATLACYIAFTISITQWRLKFKQAMNKASNSSNSVIFDALTNIDTVQKFNNQELETQKYQTHWQNYGKAQIKQESSLALLNWGQSTIFSIGLTAVMLLAAQGVQAGELTVGDLVMVNGLLLQLAMPLNIVGTVYRELKQSVLDMQTMFALRQTKSLISNIANPVDFNQRLQQRSSSESTTTTTTEAPSSSSSTTAAVDTVVNPENAIAAVTNSTHNCFPIRLENVTFSYPFNPDKHILDGISVDIPAGSSIAFVGGSGCGKSTLLKVASRQFDVTSGTIYVDNVPIQNIELSSLHNIIGSIPQETNLFNDTIFYNIHYAKPSATEEEVYTAAKLAQIHENILAMKDGYHTMVGERGVKLSGGEKQRISCARMMLVNPPVVFCDEATSSLDSKTEYEIMQNLRTLTTNKTCLYVAHRLSTITHCDQIVVLEKGRIKEQGTHQTLLSIPNGVYKTMWELQSTVDHHRNDDKSSSSESE